VYRRAARGGCVAAVTRFFSAFTIAGWIAR
jgi:hypothetical protein